MVHAVGLQAWCSVQGVCLLLRCERFVICSLGMVPEPCVLGFRSHSLVQQL